MLEGISGKEEEKKTKVTVSMPPIFALIILNGRWNVVTCICMQFKRTTVFDSDEEIDDDF